MEYVASLSGGKDSLAMVLRLMEEGRPLTKVVNFDEGMNFEAVTRNVDACEGMIREYGAELVRLKPSTPFMLSMMAVPVKGGDHYGYDWCGGRCRWMTAQKVQAIERYISTLGDNYIEYVGIASDEQHRVKCCGKKPDEDARKTYPLIEWGMSEQDCIDFCRSRGFGWDEDGVDLYDVLDRASCWCCKNKNLKELRAMRRHLPRYWGMLMGLQSRIDRPYRSDGATVFDLDRRFAEEESQQALDL